MTTPANWWIDPHDLPTSAGHTAPRRRQAPPVEWMRPDPQPLACRPARPRRAERAADEMVLWGERLALILVGLCIGGALVALLNAVVLGGVST